MPMTRVKIEKAREAALKFVAHCELLLIRLDEDVKNRGEYDPETKTQVYGRVKPAPHDHSWGCKESGALRRNSMDLTRMLADLRRGGY